MAKIDFDKYYTPRTISEKCIETTFKVLAGETVSEVVEPSAGNGSFSDQIECIAYDIQPENDRIKQADFLVTSLGYKQGRLFIGNPPFGRALSKAKAFLKKCSREGDFIAFIMPIGQLNNNRVLPNFEIKHSEDLGIIAFSGVNLHCCFNVYARSKTVIKSRNKLQCVKIIRQDSRNYESTHFDLRMCYWGNGSAGKLLSENETYAAEYKLVVVDPFKDKVKAVLKSVNWHQELKCISALKIQQFHIVELLLKNIPHIY